MMKSINVGEKVKVRCTEGISEYTLDVEVTAICPPTEFKGRVGRIFAVNGPGAPGEITGGEILKLVGQEETFKNVDLI